MNIFSRYRRSFGSRDCFARLSANSFLVLLFILAPLSLSVPVFAEEPATEEPKIAPNDTVPPNLSTYKLAVGDSFVVTVDGYPEYSKERLAVPVQQDGYVSYPLIGLIKVVGLTVSELEAEMQSAFSKHLPTARVFVTLMKPKRTILVFGAVEPRARGNLHVFEIGQVYLLQALAAAGINYALADLTDISIWRDGQLFKRVNYLNLINEGGPDVPLKDHDTIFVPSIFQQRPVRVIGAVVAPGAYPITEPQVPATQALKLAGGSRADFADLHKSEIITTEERILVDLTAENVDAVVGPGDTLYVPLAEAKISVTGAVEKPWAICHYGACPFRASHRYRRRFQRGTSKPQKMPADARRWNRRRAELRSSPLRRLLEPERSTPRSRKNTLRLAGHHLRYIICESTRYRSG